MCFYKGFVVVRIVYVRLMNKRKWTGIYSSSYAVILCRQLTRFSIDLGLNRHSALLSQAKQLVAINWPSGVFDLNIKSYAGLADVISQFDLQFDS